MVCVVLVSWLLFYSHTKSGQWGYDVVNGALIYYLI